MVFQSIAFLVSLGVLKNRSGKGTHADGLGVLDSYMLAILVECLYSQSKNSAILDYPASFLNVELLVLAEKRRCVSYIQHVMYISATPSDVTDRPTDACPAMQSKWYHMLSSINIRLPIATHSIVF